MRCAGTYRILTAAALAITACSSDPKSDETDSNEPSNLVASPENIAQQTNSRHTSVTNNAPLGGEQISEVREGVLLKRLYKEDLGDPYFTTWFARLEKTDGNWRDVYLETNEKMVASGLMSFSCSENTRSSVAWVTFGGGEFGDQASQSVTKIQATQIDSWKAGNFEPMEGENPPYELYVIARSKYC